MSLISVEGGVVHELGITQGIIERAREAAQQESAAKVRRLHLLLTPAADFGSESIEMYFAMLSEDDPMFEGATLQFDLAPAGAVCLACGDEFVTEAPQPLCPQCGSPQVRFDPAAPMVQLTGIDIDDDDDTDVQDGSDAQEDADVQDDAGGT